MLHQLPRLLAGNYPTAMCLVGSLIGVRAVLLSYLGFALRAALREKDPLVIDKHIQILQLLARLLKPWRRK